MKRNALIALAAGVVILVAAAIFVLPSVLGPGPTPTPTPMPTPTPTVEPTITPPPTPTPEPTPIPTPICPLSCRFGCLTNTTICAAPICPPECLYGCEPGTQDCKNLVCPEECLYGCEPGTSLCVVRTEDVSMNNSNFEAGNYTGWELYSNAFFQEHGSFFAPNGPKNIVLSNVPPNNLDAWCGALNQSETAFNFTLQVHGDIVRCCEILGYINSHAAACSCAANGLDNQCPGYKEALYTDFQGNYAASSTPYAPATGALISQPFMLWQPYIQFRAIGPEDADLCVAVKLENNQSFHTSCEEAKKDPATIGYFSPYIPVTFPNSHFRFVAMNLTNWTGQHAIIEVIDSSVRNYMEVDDFRQVHSPTPGVPLSPDAMPLHYAAFPCNHDGICDQFAGEFEETCPADCPPPSGCFEFAAAYPGLHSVARYTYKCASYKVTEKGLFLSVVNFGDGLNNTKLLGAWCSEQVPSDITTVKFVDLNLTESIGQPMLVANGTFPCYNSAGKLKQRKVGAIFDGRLYLLYYIPSDNSTYRVPIYVKTVVQNSTA